MSHKRKIVVNNKEYFYHISALTVCIWMPDNTKIVKSISALPDGCYVLDHEGERRVMPFHIRELILMSPEKLQSAVECSKQKPKIYIQDYGWAGCIMVIATSEHDARQLMLGNYNYSDNRKLIEREIKVGIIHENMGDS